MTTHAPGALIDWVGEESRREYFRRVPTSAYHGDDVQMMLRVFLDSDQYEPALTKEIIPFIAEIASRRYDGATTESIIPSLMIFVREGAVDQLVAVMLTRQIDTVQHTCALLKEAIQFKQHHVIRALVEMWIAHREQEQKYLLIKAFFPTFKKDLSICCVDALMPLPLITFRTTNGHQFSINVIKYLHARKLISKQDWHEILAAPIKTMDPGRLKQVWDLFFQTDSGMLPKHKLKFLGSILVKHFQPLLDFFPIIDCIFQEHPQIIHCREDALLKKALTIMSTNTFCKGNMTYRRYRLSEPINITETHVIAFVTEFLEKYPINSDTDKCYLVTGSYAKEIEEILEEYSETRGIYLDGTRIRYAFHSASRSKIVVCARELPIAGWYCCQVNGVYVYSSKIQFDPARCQFVCYGEGWGDRTINILLGSSELDESMAQNQVDIAFDQISDDDHCSIVTGSVAVPIANLPRVILDLLTKISTKQKSAASG